MELGSSLFAVDCINLNESDQFCLELEKLIREWKLSLEQVDESIDEKERSHSRIKLLKCFNLNFRITLVENDSSFVRTDYKQLLDSVLDKIKSVNYVYAEETNFVEKIHGLTNFILIQTDDRLDVLESEQIIKLINSAISCSITNTKCIYPVLIQIKDQIFELSTGVFINFGIRINYESAIFDLYQFNSSTIADFFKIFENKLKRNLQLDDNVRCFLANRRCLLNYVVRPDWRKDNLFVSNLPENLRKEFNDLDLLGHLESLRYQIKHTETLPKLQGTQWTFNADESIFNDFSRLENGCLTIQIYHLERSTIYRSSFYGQEIVNNLPKDYLQLRREELRNLSDYQLFCNRNFEAKQNYLSYFMVKSELSNDFIDGHRVQFKSTSFDSIIYRFASFVFNSYVNRLKEDSRNEDLIEREIYYQINDYWSAIVDQLRRYWELTELIPCVEDRVPDLNSCLLNQKIQMLNCCIKEKQKRESSILNQTREECKEEDDEFFDCHTDLNGEDQAEGRLEKLNLTLLNNKKKAIYKPITQDLTPYTEDNQEEYLKAYSGMNFDYESSVDIDDQDQFLVGKNILLVSDMEAFKAANPEGCFEDFILWYSPKDFIEAQYDEQTGQLCERECLSERFESPTCLWRKIWQTAKPVPISRQKRIFNYSMEAERVLDFLDSIQFDELIRHLFSTLIQIGCLKYRQIIEHSLFKSDKLIELFDRQIKQIAIKSKLCDFERTSNLLIDLDEKVMEHLGLIYVLKYTAFNSTNIQESNNETNSFDSENKLSKVDDEQLTDRQLNEILTEFANNSLYRIRRDENLGSIVFNGLNGLFDNVKQLNESRIVSSKEKEFTFVADCSRPARYSRKLPQKLNFKVSSTDESKKSKVRMNGQFSEDIVYF